MIVQAVAGELLLDSKLADKDAGRGLAALIPEGMRAYTIQTPRVTSSVAGFVLPGNRVDVLLSLRGNYNDETGGGSTTTLLQSVEILAVGQQLDAPAENKVDPKVLSSVTLLVTPDQAAKLDLGQNMGQLTLALRNPSDKEDARPQPATLADIRFRQEKPVEEPEEGEPEAKATVEPAQEEPEVYRIHTFRGKHRGEILIAPPQRDAR